MQRSHANKSSADHIGKMTMKAEDIVHVLRDGIALLPGGRSRSGQAVILCPQREQPVNQDHLRNVLVYLFEVTAKVASEKGFLVVIDMRGKQTWTNVKHILKALSSIESTSSLQVFIIKPDKIFAKPMAHFSLGTWDFDVKMDSFDALGKFVDPANLPKCVGGSYQFDHDEWLETRLELENWIWTVMEIMGKLETVRRDVCEGEQPVDVKTASEALKRSEVAKANIFNIPVDEIGKEAERIIVRISQPAKGILNPDLHATIPYVSNLIDSLRLLKGDVYKLWENRQKELDRVYQQKLVEEDAERMMEKLRSYNIIIERGMGDVGVCVNDVTRLTADFEQFQTTVKNMAVTVEQILKQINRLRSLGARTQLIDHAATRLEDEWRVLTELTERRKAILHHARSFFISAQKYFAEVPTWTAKPGVNPADVLFHQDDLEAAIKVHDAFWAQVEEVYAQAYDDASKVTRALREAEAEDNVAREHSNRLQRAHKQLMEKWKERQKLLHHMLAQIAFETDVKLVVDWLEQHGEPYLRKNINIGENRDQARGFEQNHLKFQKVAANTYGNVQKLKEVLRDVTESRNNVCDVDKMHSLMIDLCAKIEKFTATEKFRERLLKQSLLFHTHHRELTNWYAQVREKYEDRRIDLGMAECDQNKERFMLETDETASAYATTMGEGNALISDMQKAMKTFNIDYSVSIAHIHSLIADIEDKNTAIAAQWSPRRILLQIASKFALLEQNNYDVLDQIRSWEDDMREMVESESFYDKADTVMPYHKDNQAQVRKAIGDIRKLADELTQVLENQGLSDLIDKNNRNVLAAVAEHVRELYLAETRVMAYADETSYKIRAACDAGVVRQMSRNIYKIIDDGEHRLFKISVIPSDLNETIKGQDELRKFQGEVMAKLKIPYDDFVTKFRELIDNRYTQRDKIVVYSEMIQSKYRRLMNLCEERNKLLKAAHGCYKTYETAVLPILNQLETEYHSPTTTDWCAGCSSQVAADRAEYVLDLLEKHMNYKERFGKGCTYALRNGDFLLRYIRRTTADESAKMRHEKKIAMMKSNIRDRQSNILELWMQKKTQLEQCHSWILIEASAKGFLAWMSGEGEQTLRKFEKSGKTDDDEFASFKLDVKEQKTKIQTFLIVAEEQKKGIHEEDITKYIKQVRNSFEEFSKRVGNCEVVLRGENGGAAGAKDEYSLDRHSDTAIFNEKKIYEQREENRKMLEPMRELIKSERDYIKDLERCVNIYVRDFDLAVKNGTLPPPLKSMKNLRTEIFGNVEKIFEFHNDKLLNEFVKYEHQPEAVGASFTVWIDLLNELYTEYCVNKEQSNHAMDNVDVKEFFNGIRERNKLEPHDSVMSLSIKPVQRITRYQLLIDQLLKACTDKADDLKEAYEVVISVPRKVNDLIHFNCLDLKDCKLDELGPFVTQDTLSVWEPRSYFRARGKERQVFLFDLSIVFAKKVIDVMNPKQMKYVIKGKPLPLSEVSIVEHVEGDSCRFGLRVGTVASNDNRTDLKAANENTKVKWVLKIRELTSGMLPLGLGVSPALSVTTLSTARTVSIRSGASTTSSGGAGDGHRQSQDVDSLLHHRYSAHSCDSEQSSEVWIVTADFDGQAAGHLKVHKGDRVEIVEDQAMDGADYVQVVLCEQPTKHGLVPASIIAPPESGSVPDRPDDSTSGSAVSKRKSLRRIFANSSKERASSSSANNSPAARQSTSSSAVPTANGHTAESSAPAALGVLSSGEPSTANASASTPQRHSIPSASTTPTTAAGAAASASASEEEKNEDCLPPPMQNITINNSSSMDEKDVNNQDDSAAVSEPVEEAAIPEKIEKTPEETARLKRSYVLMELVETERDYVRDLTSVVEGYIGNLEKMDLPADLVGKDKIIFANIAQILDFHKTYFLKEIEKCTENYEAAGHAFVKYEKRLHALYVKYCQNKPKSDYLVSQDDFEGFFAETKAKLGHKVALCDLLIKPVQRIMKYTLLLKDILKFTERAKDSPVALKKALEVMHVVPKACDDMMQVGRLQNFDGNLNAQGKLLYQGTLQISESVAGNVQKPKDRRIFLFEQSAIIADHIPPKKEFANPTYIFKNQIMTNKMVYEAHQPDDPLRFVIKSSDSTQQTSFIANCQTQEEKDEWHRRFGDLLDQQKRFLAALVDPKRYMGGGDDLSSGLGSMNMGGSSSGGPKAGPSTTAAKSAAATASKKPAESPKKESKSKSLFSFGKKPAKSPTSPPPVGNSK